ncbi:ester cyclase [Pseudarthrobacter sp. CCNWLW207]|uniref:ester cyclase n=1 Tax=Pseudarthrobacter sp. CCNWLW207 TaxID=3127468 RepID=UPI003078323E
MTEQALAETYLRMLNTHDADLVDEFVAVDYINHNAVVADGREANRKFWTAFFMGVPDLTAIMDDLVIAGDRVVGRFVSAARTPGTSWASRLAASR